LGQFHEKKNYLKKHGTYPPWYFLLWFSWKIICRITLGFGGKFRYKIFASTSRSSFLLQKIKI
jgi:hypothetical protein